MAKGNLPEKESQDSNIEEDFLDKINYNIFEYQEVVYDCMI